VVPKKLRVLKTLPTRFLYFFPFLVDSNGFVLLRIDSWFRRHQKDAIENIFEEIKIHPERKLTKKNRKKFGTAVKCRKFIITFAEPYRGKASKVLKTSIYKRFFWSVHFSVHSKISIFFYILFATFVVNFTSLLF
jgi:hypothetical protein